MDRQFADTLVMMHRSMSIRPVLYAVLIALAFLVRVEGLVITAAGADEASKLPYPGQHAANCKPAPVVGCVCEVDPAEPGRQLVQSTSEWRDDSGRVLDSEYLRMMEWLRLTCTAFTRSEGIR